MDAPPPLPSLLFSAAQLAAEQAAVRLLLPDALEAPSSLCHALQGIAALAGALWREERYAPSRAELLALLDWPQPDLEVLRRRLSDTPIIAATLLRLVQEDVAVARKRLAGRGQSDAFDQLGCPSPKLLIACGVVALRQEIGGSPLNIKNTQLRALLGALLWWAREQVGHPVAGPDTSMGQWERPWRDARRLYKTVGVVMAGAESAGELAQFAVRVALRRHTDRGAE
jgi:hypothetical protein